MPAKIYQIANNSDQELLEDVMLRYHAPLDEADVKVALIIARKFDKEEQPMPCVKFAGTYANAIVKKLSIKTRLLMSRPHDAEIEIDGMRWDDLTQEERQALLDHELSHIRLVTDQNGIVKTEDDNRPMIKLIPDDFLLTGFNDVVQRHRESALEWQSVRHVHDGLVHILQQAAAETAERA